MTPRPSKSPSFTTFIPSSSPSITGLVVTLTLTSNDDTLDTTGLESQLANEYGVEVDDVTIDTTYTVTGTIDINVDDDTADDQLERILQDTIADALGIHSSNVQVNIDPSTGDVTYAIVNDDDNIASAIQESLESLPFLEILNDGISDILPSASVFEISSDDDIEMEVVITVDASESDIDVEDANNRIISEFEDEGFSTAIEVVFITARPSIQPIVSPTSSVPSAAPSRTGIIAIFEITSVVTESLSDDEVQAIEAEIISGFDVSDGDIKSTGISAYIS